MAGPTSPRASVRGLRADTSTKAGQCPLSPFQPPLPSTGSPALCIRQQAAWGGREGLSGPDLHVSVRGSRLLAVAMSLPLFCLNTVMIQCLFCSSMVHLYVLSCCHVGGVPCVFWFLVANALCVLDGLTLAFIFDIHE